MAQIKSQIKRIGTNEKARIRNQAFRSKVRTQIKKFNVAVEANDVVKAKEELAKSISLIDQAVGKKVIHKNAAARQKSHIQTLFNSLQA
ncbi:MAG: 30S ribosomal protein S20 [Bacilli bacterium]|jgi:small subunit ribosomal protein S20|nr:30S ribosomal protein S20 [Bacilli bacterium]